MGVSMWVGRGAATITQLRSLAPENLRREAASIECQGMGVKHSMHSTAQRQIHVHQSLTDSAQSHCSRLKRLPPGCCPAEEASHVVCSSCRSMGWYCRGGSEQRQGQRQTSMCAACSLQCWPLCSIAMPRAGQTWFASLRQQPAVSVAPGSRPLCPPPVPAHPPS